MNWHKLNYEEQLQSIESRIIRLKQRFDEISVITKTIDTKNQLRYEVRNSILELDEIDRYVNLLISQLESIKKQSE